MGCPLCVAGNTYRTGTPIGATVAQTRGFAVSGVQGLKLASPAREIMVTKAGLEAMRQRAQIQHHGMIAGLCGEHPAAAESCRLAKRWIATQLLSFHVPGELVELLVAAVFTG
jgi:hypothetical protein